MAPRPEEQRGAVYLALCTGTIAFALAFTYPMYVPTRVLWYLPLERDWVLAIKPKALGADFYGRVLLALGAWTIGAVPTWLLARRRRPPSARTLGLFTAWAITATLLAMLHYTWILYFRQPIPEPLPAWYEAR